MRRLTFVSVLCAVVLAGCGGGEEVAPVAEEVEGTVPTQTLPEGNAAAGATVYEANGCGGCHTYAPAKSNGKVGPGLDELAGSAEEAEAESVEEYARSSIVNPNAYIHPGFQEGVMPAYNLPEKQLADLVAFVTQGEGEGGEG